MSHAVTDAQLRRLGSAGAVLLLHLALLTAFIFAMNSRLRVAHAVQEIEVSFPRYVARPPPPVIPLSPELIAPVMPSRPMPPSGLSVPELAPPPPGSIRGVGRALFGCDPSRLDTLPPEQRAACLRLPPGKPHEQSVLLGPVSNSPFAKVIEERFRKANPINHPCRLGTYNDVHGLPCLFDFSNDPPPPHQ